MSKYEKIIQKMKTVPHTIRIDEVIKVLEVNGFLFKRQKGSHMVFRNSDSGSMIVLPNRSVVKACYIDEVLRKVGEIDEG